jgi:hypothetical protein
VNRSSSSIVAFAVLAVVAYVVVRHLGGRPVNLLGGLASTSPAPGDQATAGLSPFSGVSQPVPSDAGNPFVTQVTPVGNFAETMPIKTTWTQKELADQHEAEVRDALKFYAVAAF